MEAVFSIGAFILLAALIHGSFGYRYRDRAAPHADEIMVRFNLIGSGSGNAGAARSFPWTGGGKPAPAPEAPPGPGSLRVWRFGARWIPVRVEKTALGSIKNHRSP